MDLVVLPLPNGQVPWPVESHSNDAPVSATYLTTIPAGKTPRLSLAERLLDAIAKWSASCRFDVKPYASITRSSTTLLYPICSKGNLLISAALSTNAKLYWFLHLIEVGPLRFVGLVESWWALPRSTEQRSLPCASQHYNRHHHALLACWCILPDHWYVYGYCPRYGARWSSA